MLVEAFRLQLVFGVVRLGGVSGGVDPTGDGRGARGVAVLKAGPFEDRGSVAGLAHEDAAAAGRVRDVEVDPQGRAKRPPRDLAGLPEAQGPEEVLGVAVRRDSQNAVVDVEGRGHVD